MTAKSLSEALQVATTSLLLTINKKKNKTKLCDTYTDVSLTFNISNIYNNTTNSINLTNKILRQLDLKTEPVKIVTKLIKDTPHRSLSVTKNTSKKLSIKKTLAKIKRLIR